MSFLEIIKVGGFLQEGGYIRKNVNDGFAVDDLKGFKG